MFGARLPEFLAEFEPAATLPYLADVARLEWARQVAYHAAEQPPLDATELARLPEHRLPGLRLVMRAGATLLHSPHPVHAIWRAHQDDPDETPVIDLDRAESVLVMRPVFEVETVELGTGEYTWLRALTRRATIETAVAAAAAIDPLFDLTACLQRHLALGTFARAESDTPKPFNRDHPESSR